MLIIFSKVMKSGWSEYKSQTVPCDIGHLNIKGHQ
jgi:hypothetical protein